MKLSRFEYNIVHISGESTYSLVGVLPVNRLQQPT